MHRLTLFHSPQQIPKFVTVHFTLTSLHHDSKIKGLAGNSLTPGSLRHVSQLIT